MPLFYDNVQFMMDEEISELAKKFVKANKKEIKEHFAGDSICLPDENPVSIFMAGSPGAGKTEFSKWFLKVTEMPAVRIDTDEARDYIPHYDGHNASVVQGAASMAVEYIHDHVIKKKKNMVLDATFANYEISLSNVKRSLNKGRHVEIFYLYQDPLVAWKFTQYREKLEGRIVPKEIFVESFFKAGENVNKVKKEFGKQLQLHIAIKNFENGLEKFKLNVESIDPYVNMIYNRTSLMEKL